MQQLEPGRVIHDKYRLIRLLGSGGFGAVYEAEHIRVAGPPFALKVLHAGTFEPEQRARFFQEVTIARTLLHPHIVTVRDCDVSPDGICYFTMDLVPGEPLSALWRREGRLPWRRAADIVRQTLLALGEAHRHGVIHRDVKPANVVVERKAGGHDFARVLDFGIAKLRAPGDARGLTVQGTLMGTPHYMSPEQARGVEVDPRSDIYSAGAVLYALVTGVPVFDGETQADITSGHLRDTPQPMCARAPEVEVPAGLDALVLRTLQKRPEDRFPGAEEMVAALERVLDGREEAPPAAAAGTDGDTTLVSGPRPRSPSGRAPAATPAPDETLRPLDVGALEGVTLDRYVVEAKLGAGGFGVVYRARHRHLQRPVAIKAMRPDADLDDTLIERFRREARAASRIKHPNAVDVTDFFEHRGCLFIVMELVEGESLGDLMRRERALPPERAVAIADQVLAGLGAAHAAGIIHRDVKPENVLIARSGDVKVCDFGIARVFAGPEDAVPRITDSNAFIGTPAYMAPELWLGDPIDARTDLYAVGILLHEMLAGRKPITASGIEDFIKAHTQQVLPRLAELRGPAAAPVPAPLEEALARAVAKKPADRFPDSGAMREALRAGLSPSDTARRRRGSASGERFQGLDRLKLVTGQRTDFVFATESLRLGRTKPGPDGSGSDAVLRLLPCRGPDVDAENYRRTLLVSACHGELVLLSGRVQVIDRSTRGLLVDGTEIAREEPIALPPTFTLELGDSGLRLAGRIVLDPQTREPAGVRLERLENAPHLAYIWVLGRVEIGPLDGALPLDAEPAFGASLVNTGGRLEFFRPPDLPRPLRPGEALKGRRATVLVGALNAADMTTG